VTAPAHEPRSPEVELRGLEPADARTLALLYRAEREFLAPFEPDRPARFFTIAGQRELLRRDMIAAEEDRRYGFAIVADDETVGVLHLNNVKRGASESGSLGYFVARRHNGRGIASAAVALVCEWAFGMLGLQRLEAATLVDNWASQRVLSRNGFRPVGLVPEYLWIGGGWRDHVLFSRRSEDPATDHGPTDWIVARLQEVIPG
jgi:[ribosomal protein S5]-alanine N-acetyltransferase